MKSYHFEYTSFSRDYYRLSEIQIWEYIIPCISSQPHEYLNPYNYLCIHLLMHMMKNIELNFCNACSYPGRISCNRIWLETGRLH